MQNCNEIQNAFHDSNQNQLVSSINTFDYLIKTAATTVKINFTHPPPIMQQKDQALILK